MGRVAPGTVPETSLQHLAAFRTLESFSLPFNTWDPPVDGAGIRRFVETEGAQKNFGKARWTRSSG
jgi:hypothetical protein